VWFARFVVADMVTHMNKQLRRRWGHGFFAALALGFFVSCRDAQQSKTSWAPNARSSDVVVDSQSPSTTQKTPQPKVTDKNALVSIAGTTVVGLLASPLDGGPLFAASALSPEKTKKMPFGKNVVLEIEGDKRRVLVNAVVCLRAGMLEQLLCKRGTKEHESILSADVDAKHIHAALIAARAEPGSPVSFKPAYTPATGTAIKVYIQYEDKGKTIKVPAQQWVRNMKTQKELSADWVFAGSALYPHPFDPDSPPLYAANEGDVICVANFPSAMLDLPIASSAVNDDLDFDAFTQRIPTEGTEVVVILEPVLPVQKK